MISKELIRRFKNGDEDAFSFLYKHYWEKVYGFTRLYLVSSEDIAEVVQEVFIKLWEARHLIDEEQPFEGFLFIICLLYTSPSPRDLSTSRMPSSA